MIPGPGGLVLTAIQLGRPLVLRGAKAGVRLRVTPLGPVDPAPAPMFFRPQRLPGASASAASA